MNSVAAALSLHKSEVASCCQPTIYLLKYALRFHIGLVEFAFNAPLMLLLVDLRISPPL